MPANAIAPLAALASMLRAVLRVTLARIISPLPSCAVGPASHLKISRVSICRLISNDIYNVSYTTYNLCKQIK